MFCEYESVIILQSGVKGVIVDKRMVNGKTIYVVEEEKRNEVGEYPLHDCTDDDLVKNEQ